MAEEVDYCGVCAKTGKISKLKVYQINLDEAIRICEDEQCTYPNGIEKSAWVLNRKFSELQVSKPSTTAKRPIPQQNKNPTKYGPVKTPGIGSQRNHADGRKSLPAPIQSRGNRNRNALPARPQTKIEKNLAPYATGSASKPNNNVHTSPAPTTILEIKASGDTKLAASRSRMEIGKSFKSGVSKSKNPSKPLMKFNDTQAQAAERTEIKYCRSPNILENEMRAFYPQWQNKDALCWLDVILCLLVHCKQVKKLNDCDLKTDPSIITTLLKAYDQALSLLSMKLNAKPTVSDPNLSSESEPPIRNEAVASCMENGGSDSEDNHTVTADKSNVYSQGEVVQTGAGLQLMNSDFLHLISSSQSSFEFSKAFSLLGDIRERIWHLLHPRLRCKKGQNDSPVFAIPLLAKNSKDMEHLLLLKYNFHFSCKKCGYKHDFPYEKVLPTFPNTAYDFAMDEPKFLKSCFQCHASGQSMTMKFERIPPVLMLHFQEGLPHNRFSGYDFKHAGQQYKVTGVIQFRNDPDHFITWIRNPNGELWMECNDLKSSVCQFTKTAPSFPANQVHIVMWEATDHLANCESYQNLDTDQMCMDDSPVSSGNTEILMETEMSSNCESIVVPSGNGNIHDLGDSSSINVVPSTKPMFSKNVSNMFSSSPLNTSHDASQVANGYVMVSNVDSQVSGVTDSSGDVSATSDDNYKLVSNTGKVLNVLMHNDLKKPPVGSDSDKLFQVGRQCSAKHCTNGVPVNVKESKPPGTNNILEKTKGNISLLRILKNPRSVSTRQRFPVADPRGQHPVARQSSSLAHGSLEILSRILGNRNGKQQEVTPCLKGKVFEGYRSKASKSSDDSMSNFKTCSTSSVDDTDTESLTSRPSSPALSCHSDSFVVQKRKSDLFSEKNSLPAMKRRRSQDTNFTTEVQCLPLHAKSLSLDSATVFRVSKKKDSPVSIETISNGICNSIPEMPVCHKTELITSDRYSQESDILQNLYSALNIDMPGVMDDDKLPVKAVDEGKRSADVENIPDISELDKFINSDCDSNMEDNFDDFLSQL